MVKIFIGNLSLNAEKEELEALFTHYGTVTECAKYKNYAFVHMEDRKSATKAIRELHLYKLHGRPINVEPSRGKNQGPAKLHIANVEKGYDDELRALFEEYGSVTECAIVKNFAFVHMANSDEAMDAIKGLDNSEFHGKRIHVQLSKSRPRGGPPEMEDYGPPMGPPRGGGGYFPPRYPTDRPEPPSFRDRMPGGYPAPPPPPPPQRRPGYPPERPSPYGERPSPYGERPSPYGERPAPYGERDGYGAPLVDYYEKYRARPYSAPAYDRPNPIPPPPPPSGAVRDHLSAPPLNPYERRPLPPPPPPNYYGRDRSPLRRAPPPPPPAAGNGYSYERSRLSPVPRPPMYGAPRPFAERVPPPPPRYASY